MLNTRVPADRHHRLGRSGHPLHAPGPTKPRRSAGRRCGSAGSARRRHMSRSPRILRTRDELKDATNDKSSWCARRSKPTRISARAALAHDRAETGRCPMPACQRRGPMTLQTYIIPSRGRDLWSRDRTCPWVIRPIRRLTRSPRAEPYLRCSLQISISARISHPSGKTSSSPAAPSSSTGSSTSSRTESRRTSRRCRCWSTAAGRGGWRLRWLARPGWSRQSIDRPRWLASLDVRPNGAAGTHRVSDGRRLFASRRKFDLICCVHVLQRLSPTRDSP